MRVDHGQISECLPVKEFNRLRSIETAARAVVEDVGELILSHSMSSAVATQFYEHVEALAKALEQEDQPCK